MASSATTTTEAILESMSEVRASDPLYAFRPDATNGVVYCLPLSLLQAIYQCAPSFFSENEYRQELRLSEDCSTHFAIGCRKPHQQAAFHWLVSFPLLFPSKETITHDCNKIQEQLSISDDSADSLKQSLSILNDTRERQLAYLGWLLHNKRFLTEKKALQDKYSELAAIFPTFPTYPAHHFVESIQKVHGLRCDDDSLITFADVFDAFCQKWQVAGLATWDIPLPSTAILGGPSCLSKFVPDQMGSTVKIPGALRLSARSRPEALIRNSVPVHLHDWEKVLDNKHPSKLSYSRWNRLFQLAFYRDIVLARNYPDRMKRHAGRLDQAFSDFFGDEDCQAIRKLRSKQNKLRR